MKKHNRATLKSKKLLVPFGHSWLGWLGRTVLPLTLRCERSELAALELPVFLSGVGRKLLQVTWCIMESNM